MSEATTEELVPLAPAEEGNAQVDVETQVEGDEGSESTPAPADTFSKPLQRVQQDSANMRREMAELKNLILAQAAKPQTAAVKDRLDAMLEEAKEYGDANPELMKIVKTLAEEIREGKATRTDLQRKLDEVQGNSAFENFMAGRPPAFRTEFSEAQAELVDSAVQEYGEKPSTRELRLAMTAWVKNWDKQNQTTNKSNNTSGQRRSTLIPAGAGPRNSGKVSLASALANGQVPDGRGGYKDGNLLGI